MGDAFIISQLFVVPLSLDFALVRYPKTLWAREMAFAISFNDLEMKEVSRNNSQRIDKVDVHV